MKLRKGKRRGVALCRDCAWYYSAFMQVSLRLEEPVRLCRCESCARPGLLERFELEQMGKPGKAGVK